MSAEKSKRRNRLSQTAKSTNLAGLINPRLERDQLLNSGRDLSLDDINLINEIDILARELDPSPLSRLGSIGRLSSQGIATNLIDGSTNLVERPTITRDALSGIAAPPHNSNLMRLGALQSTNAAKAHDGSQLRKRGMLLAQALNELSSPTRTELSSNQIQSQESMGDSSQYKDGALRAGDRDDAPLQRVAVGVSDSETERGKEHQRDDAACGQMAARIFALQADAAAWQQAAIEAGQLINELYDAQRIEQEESDEAAKEKTEKIIVKVARSRFQKTPVGLIFVAGKWVSDRAERQKRFKQTIEALERQIKDFKGKEEEAIENAERLLDEYGSAGCPPLEHFRPPA